MVEMVKLLAIPMWPQRKTNITMSLRHEFWCVHDYLHEQMCFMSYEKIRVSKILKSGLTKQKIILRYSWIVVFPDKRRFHTNHIVTHQSASSIMKYTETFCIASRTVRPLYHSCDAIFSTIHMHQHPIWFHQRAHRYV